METNNYEQLKGSKREIWWSGASSTHFVYAGVAVVILLVILLALQFLLNSPLPPDYRPGYDEIQTFGLTIVAAVGIAGWSVSVSVRCSDAVVKKYVMGISFLFIFWLLVVLVKYIVPNDTVAEFCWYLYYIPLEGVPLLLLFTGMKVAATERYRFDKQVKMVASIITLFFVLLVLTNSLHHLVFTFDITSPNWSEVYNYEIGYWLAAGWAISLCVVFLGLLFAASRASLRSVVLVLAMLVTVVFSYGALYVLRIEWAFSSNIALNYSLAAILLLEFCLDFGILPSCIWLRDAFMALPLDMKIVDRNLNVVFTTSESRPFEGEVVEVAESRMRSPKGVARNVLSQDEKLLYTSYFVDNSVVLVTKDISTLTERKNKLRRRADMLRRRNAMLERQSSIRALLLKQSRERELLAEAENSITNALVLAQDLLSRNPANETEREDILQKVKLIMFYCKRKGSLALSEKTEDEFERDRLLLVMTEAAGELRAAGVFAAAVVDISKPLPARSVSLFYDCFCEFSKLGLLGTDPVLMGSIYQWGNDRAEMICNLEVQIDRDEVFYRVLNSLKVLLSEKHASFELEESPEGVRLHVFEPSLEEEGVK